MFSRGEPNGNELNRGFQAGYRDRFLKLESVPSLPTDQLFRIGYLLGITARLERT